MHTLQCLYLYLSLCNISQLLGVACISALSAFFISLFFLQKMPFVVELDEERTERACLKALKAKMRRQFTHALGRFMLDHSTALKSAMSWSCFWIFIVAIPVISFCKVTAADSHQLPFARLVLLLETGEAVIAYVSFWHMLTRHKEPVGEELVEEGLAQLDSSDIFAKKGDREKSLQEKKDAESPPLSSNGNRGSSGMEKASEKKSFFVIFLMSIKHQPVQIQATYLNNLQMVNLVGLAGSSVCLVSASKIAHLHRKIVETASIMHSKHTYGIQKLNAPTVSGKSLSHLELSSSNISSEDKQREWRERVTLMTYLSATTAGISVYGFVLDRSFVHTSFGALLTTTWFVLGRSLEALGCTCSNVCPSAPPPSNHPPPLGLQFPY